MPIETSSLSAIKGTYYPDNNIKSNQSPLRVISGVDLSPPQDYPGIMSRTSLDGNYYVTIVVSLVVVVFLSFVLPNLSTKARVSSEVKEIKNIINMMTEEVNHAEMACLTAANDVCVLHTTVLGRTKDAAPTVRNLRDLSNYSTSDKLHESRSEPLQSAVERINHIRKAFLPSKHPSNKEIPLMSYVYTNSFNRGRSTKLNSKEDRPVTS